MKVFIFTLISITSLFSQAQCPEFVEFNFYLSDNKVLVRAPSINSINELANINKPFIRREDGTLIRGEGGTVIRGAGYEYTIQESKKEVLMKINCK